MFKTALALLLGSVMLLAAEYRYIEPADAAKLIREKSPITIVDIQVKEDYKEEHLKGAISTWAYPVKTPEEKARLKEVASSINPSHQVIVVCPRGGGGAKRAYDTLRENGIGTSRMVILKNGQHNWPRESIKDVLMQTDLQ